MNKLNVKGLKLNALRRGFSLIEMLIAVSILVILSGIVISYGRGISGSLTLANQEAALLGLISRAKALSQSFSIADAPGGKEICAYGLNVDRINNRALIFRDMVDSDIDCDMSDNTYNEGEEMPGVNDLFYLDRGLLFGNSTDISIPNLNDIVFIPPDPIVIINDDPTDLNDPTKGTKSASIFVRGKDDANLNFEIVVTSSGQIEIQ